MRYKFLVVTVLLFALSFQVHAQTELVETYRELYEFCTDVVSNVTSGSDTNVTRCANPDEITPLMCTTLVDSLNLRELVAVVHAKGIAFYHVFPISGNVTLLANYPSSCAKLFVLGFLEDRVLIGSGEDNTTGTNTTTGSNTTGCEPLGVGSILFSDILSSNVTGEVTILEAIPQTSAFEFISKGFLFQPNSTLWIFGPDGDTNRTLVLDLSGGVENFTVLVDFPVNPLDNIDVENAVLFSLGAGDNTTTGNFSGVFVVAPVLDENRVEVYDVSDVNGTTLAGSINVTNPRKVAVSSSGTALYIASRLSEVSTSNDTTTFPSDDILLIVDSSSFANLTNVLNITFLDLGGANISTEGDNTTSSNQTHTITSLFTSFNYLWIGWNTGELSVWNITADLLAPELINVTLTIAPNASVLSSFTALPEWGVQDICGSLIDNNKAWVTVTEPPLEGDLFIGYILTGAGTDFTSGGTDGGFGGGGGGGGGGGTSPEPTFPSGEPTFPTGEPTFPTGEPTFPTGEPTFPTGEPTIPEPTSSGGGTSASSSSGGVTTEEPTVSSSAEPSTSFESSSSSSSSSFTSEPPTSESSSGDLTSPDFSSPDFSSPDFSSPDYSTEA
jgi:hypothetical protein